MIRVLIVHQSQLICSLISSVLSEEADIYVISYATNVADAKLKVDRSNCNMVLVAATLPDQGALKLTEELASEHLNISVLVIGLPKSENVILQYVAAGAAGYVLRDVSVEHLVENVRAVHDDKAIISPKVAAALMNRMAELSRLSTQHTVDPSAFKSLTPREVEVLRLIDEGLTNQEIADRLFIEVGTVKNHVHNILKKLDVSSREEAAAFLPHSSEERL